MSDLDKRSIPYRPEYNAITGSVRASILMQQMWYWWDKSNHHPFYKYRAPCAAASYREGDSWTEELGFTPYQFDSALRSIATKITTGDSKTALLKVSLVVYWTDSDRKTWYEVNESLYCKLVGLAYENPELLTNLNISNVLGKEDMNTVLDTDDAFEQMFPRDNPPQPTNAKTSAADVEDMVVDATRRYMQRTDSRAAWYEGGRVHAMGGVSAESLRSVCRIVDDVTGLRPGSNITGWLVGAAEVYRIADGDLETVERGVREAWSREPQYRPSTLACSQKTAARNGFVKAVNKAQATANDANNNDNNLGGLSVEEALS